MSPCDQDHAAVGAEKALRIQFHVLADHQALRGSAAAGRSPPAQPAVAVDLHVERGTTTWSIVPRQAHQHVGEQQPTRHPSSRTMQPPETSASIASPQRRPGRARTWPAAAAPGGPDRPVLVDTSAFMVARSRVGRPVGVHGADIAPVGAEGGVATPTSLNDGPAPGSRPLPRDQVPCRSRGSRNPVLRIVLEQAVQVVGGGTM